MINCDYRFSEGRKCLKRKALHVGQLEGSLSHGKKESSIHSLQPLPRDSSDKDSGSHVGWQEQ